MLDPIGQGDLGFSFAFRDLGRDHGRFGKGAGNVAAVRAQVENARELAVDVEEAIDQPPSNFIFEVVRLAAVLGVGGSSFFLEIFDVLVEDLEGRGAR